MTCQGNTLTSSEALKVGAIYLQGNNEINCDIDLYLNNRGGRNIIANAGGGYFEARGALHAKAGVTSYITNPNLGWDNWHTTNRPFMAPMVTVLEGAYYPVIGWSSVMPNGYIQYASIGSLRDGGFGRVAITVGNSDNNSSSAKYFFHNNGTFESSNILATGVIQGQSGIYLNGLSANTHSHIRLVNASSGRQWGIKSGMYMTNETDFTITDDTNGVTPMFRLAAGGNAFVTGYLSASTSLYASNGYLYSIANGHSIRIGSENSSYCHYVTTASAHWFNTRVEIDGYLCPHGGTPRYHLGSSSNQWLEGHFYNWLRIYDTRGNEGGLYFQNWGGGITMQDSTYVRVYGAKCFLVGSSLYYSINNSGGYYRGSYGGSSWSNGRGALNVDIFNNGNQTPLIVAARGDGFESATSNRLFAMELLNSGSMMVFAFNAVQRFTFHSNGLLLTNDDQVAFSDMRLKTEVDDYAIDIRDFVDAPLFTYYKKGSEKDGLRVGTSAQWMLDHMRLCVYGSEKDYYSYSYARGGFILGVSIIKRLVPWMDEKDKKIEELERRIRILESRQAS